MTEPTLDDLVGEAGLDASLADAFRSEDVTVEILLNSSLTERREVLMQFLPAASGLDRHITIFQIDLDDGIHAGHIDQHAVGRAGDVTAGIAHTAPAGGASGPQATLASGVLRELALY